MAKFLAMILAITVALLLMVQFGLDPRGEAQPATTSRPPSASPLTAPSLNTALPDSLIAPATASGASSPKGSPTAASASGGTAANRGRNMEYVDPKEQIVNDLLLGDRNPFMPPRYILEREYVRPEEGIDNKMEAIRRWPLYDYQIVGIIWDVRNPKAMVKDRNGNLHIVRRNNRIGNQEGIISDINEGEIIVVEKKTPKVLSMVKVESTKGN
jgi:type IV pilus assembly protein PilP